MRVTNDGVKPTMPISTGAQLLQITPRQYEVLVLLARGYPSACM
ncbi:luxR family regulatory protein [Bordetella pertussis]|nr:luxR family regulatory protein [Bordetella pertussis]